MSLRRFFIPPPEGGNAELTGADAEHLTRVLRVETGQKFELSDNRRVYLGEVEAARKSLVRFRIVEELSSRRCGADITLAPALFKFARFEWLIEKATELGVGVIRPWEAGRSDAGLAQAAKKRRGRWERIALEASQQARRDHLPEIANVTGLAALLGTEARVRLAFDEDPAAAPILESLPAARGAEDTILLLCGPEGGLMDSERAQIEAAGWTRCSLGPTILRAETAGLAALSIVQAVWGAKAG